MARWVCNARVRYGQTEELRGRLGTVSISEAMRIGRLCSFGPVEEMDENDWVKCFKCVEVEARVAIGRPRKTWDEGLRKDLESKVLQLNIHLALSYTTSTQFLL